MKSVAIIQARLGSTRFPRKVLAILHGKSVLAHVVEAAKRIEGIDDLVVAVPGDESSEWIALTQAEDSPLPDCPYYIDQSVGANDVLGRYAAAARSRKADIIVRITGDCPLLDPEISSEVLHTLKANRGAVFATNDVLCSGFPDGLDTEAFTADLLMAADQRAERASDREHVTPWMRRHAPVQMGNTFGAQIIIDDWREKYRKHRHAKWSIDTEADLEVVAAEMNYRRALRAEAR